MKKFRKKNGITLIALVITIIVLLILAGISIAMLTGDNGILKKATTAKEENTKASAEEKVKIAVYGSYNVEGKIDATELKQNLNNVEGIDKTTTNIKRLPATVICDGYEVTINGTLDGQKLEPGEIVTGKNEKYTKNGTAVIPVGFAIVPELDDVSEGLVISDVANDTENQGNQFVWIPVTDMSKFVRKDGYYNNNLQTMVSNGDCQEPLASGGYDKEVEEYNAMKKSIEENKGFYVGRYETGKDESKNAVVKKDKPVYTNIKWGNSMIDSTGGAVEIARNFAKEKGYTNVTSTLIYGLQWDVIMQFIDNNYMDGECSETSYLRNSIGKGNCGTGHQITTGSNENYKMKNIYDMAGNAWEWTMEASGNSFRVIRGGDCINVGSYYPVSNRFGGYTPDERYATVSLHPALYL